MGDDSNSGRVTRLLAAMRDGRSDPGDELLALVYEHLRAMARRQMARAPAGDTLEPTALVHEAYIRLMGKADHDWQNRRHFFAMAARAMRDIVIEEARRHAALKRGGGRQTLSLDENRIAAAAQFDDLLVLEEALSRLKERDPMSWEVVMLRFFAGLSGDQTAAALGVSPSTVDRYWQYARAWLHRELAGSTR